MGGVGVVVIGGAGVGIGVELEQWAVLVTQHPHSEQHNDGSLQMPFPRDPPPQVRPEVGMSGSVGAGDGVMGVGPEQPALG